MLEMKHVTKIFNPGTVNEHVALNDFNLTLEDGDFVTVIGSNGAGKSSMMNAIAGVWLVDSGEILIDGVNITKLPEHKRAKFLGRVFQDPRTGTASTMWLSVVVRQDPFPPVLPVRNPRNTRRCLRYWDWVWKTV